MAQVHVFTGVAQQSLVLIIMVMFVGARIILDCVVGLGLIWSNFCLVNFGSVW